MRDTASISRLRPMSAVQLRQINGGATTTAMATATATATATAAMPTATATATASATATPAATSSNNNNSCSVLASVSQIRGDLQSIITSVL